ncbi:hypothetical protein JCM10213_005794 [Rhodosporidiobolus nylandii]
MSTPRAATSAASSSANASATSNNTANGATAAQADDEGAGAAAEGGVKRILSVQKGAGMEGQYIVELEGGGRKMRSRTVLQQLAPSLLAAFDASQLASDPPSSDSPAASGSDNSEVVVMRQLRGSKAPASRRGKARAAEDEEMGDGSEEEQDDDGDVSMAEPSSEEDDDSGADDESDEDDLSFRRSSRVGKKKKPKQEAIRHSSRNGGRKKHYDFGDGQGQQPDTDEEEDDLASSGSGRGGQRGTRSRSTRYSTRSSSSRDEERASAGTRGSSSDELSIQAKPRREKAPPQRRAVNQARVADSEEYEDEVDESAGSSLSSPCSSRATEDWRPQDKHRHTCTKCNQEPADELLRKFHQRQSRKKGAKAKKRDVLEEDTDAELEGLEKLGSWVECGVCCSAYHFGCLPAPHKKQLVGSLKAEHSAAHTASAAASTASSLTPLPEAGDSPQEQKNNADLPKREKHELDTARAFVLSKCPACKKQGGRRCFVCGISGRRVTEREIEELAPKAKKAEGAAEGEEKADPASGIEPGLMFRCSKCKRISHYGCLENEEPEWTFQQHCQSYFDWQICHDCYNFNVPLDAILAWAPADPLPQGDKDDIESDDEIVEKIVGEKRVDEKTKQVYEIPAAKDPRANAKYLVKWVDMSYRHLAWVPHAYLMAAYPAKLANFLARGSTVSFEPAKDDEPEDGAEEGDEKDDQAPLPDANAEDRIPVAWRTVDRVLEVWYQHPKREGEKVPHADYARRYDLPEDTEEALALVVQCKMKWGDLAYRECTDEAPPESDEEGYEAYVAAYKAFLAACDRSMSIPSLNKQLMAELNKPRDPARFVPLEEQPAYITGGNLMDFQLAGINFLRFQWWQRTGCILADEMGLGKTCQVISFLAHLNQDEGARPFLVAVPNSLVGNWMREFARWAPSMRVVPYNGDAESRKIVEEYELFDSRGQLKTHVVLVTYEALQGNAHVFRRVDRWDCIVIDEGQRLKSGKDSQLYRAINSLNIAQRVLLSGTPLNNNLREVFNLLHFINPHKIPNVDKLTEEYAELTKERVEAVREMLKPHFLRRTKDLVLNLPPLVDVVVPVTMTGLQRQIYRGILERNASAIQSVVQKTGSTKKPKKSSFANILMELRKLLCHPYLVDADIEPRNTTPEQAQINLTEACAKFVLLQRMLPKLQAAGHRVLIFSQFKLTLNIIERFLQGLKLKYLRLDGDTPQLERQRDVDKYNAPGSEYFAYLLSTRAGGVGLNITSADVVIIYDQDFNPQMDLQAISRAHRIGQKKPVRVFKLLSKGTCEEKIFMAGNEKLGLEHLIIQRIDAKDESEDVETMLQFGAQAVFDEAAAEAAAIRYSDADIDALLKKTAEPSAQETEAAGTFAQAQVWDRAKGGLDDAAALDKADGTDAGGEDLHSFWAQLADKQLEDERQQKAAKEAAVGRGKRRRAQVNYKLDVLSPKKAKKTNSKSPSIDSGLSSGDEYRHRAEDVDSDDEWTAPMDVDDLPQHDDPLRPPPPLARTEPSETGSAEMHKSKKRKSATAVSTADAAQEAEVARKRQEASAQATAVINKLLRAAIQAGDMEIQGLLTVCRSLTSRSQQTELLEKAARLLRERSRALRAVQPSNALPAAASQGAACVPPAHAPSTSGTPASSSASKALANSGGGAPSATTKVKPKKAAPSAPALTAKATRPSPPASTSSATKPKKVSPQLDAIKPAPKASMSKPPSPPLTALTPALQRADSGGQHSDSSSGRSTPKFKQQTLSFGKKPSPPAASTSGAAPAPSTSTPRAAPAKRPSPSSAKPVAKRPTPPTSSAKKAEPVVIDLISDSEDE